MSHSDSVVTVSALDLKSDEKRGVARQWPFLMDEHKCAISYSMPDFDGSIVCNKDHLMLILVCSHAYKMRVRDYIVEQYGVTLVYSGPQMLGFQSPNNCYNSSGEKRACAVDVKAIPNLLALDTVVRRWVGKAYVLYRSIPAEGAQFMQQVCQWEKLKGKILKLECRPESITKRLIRDLPLDVDLDPHDEKFTHVLQIIQLQPPKGLPDSHIAFVGLSPRHAMFSANPDVVAAKEEQAVCRAQFKIREILVRLGLDQRERAGGGVDRTSDGSGGQGKDRAVIDIGASPGGWSKHCADAGYGLVAAIDPGEMDGEILASTPEIVHLRMLVEDEQCLPALHKLVTGKFAEGFDTVICDMNAHPEACARAIMNVVPTLKPGAVLVLTLKLVHRGGAVESRRMFEFASAVLEPHFHQFKMWWLFANSKYERTLTAVRK
jgi:23S rRNA U2552 (ribose-2'-O)-methylase RlmE/FtsJ